MTRQNKFEKVLTLSTAHMPNHNPDFGGLRVTDFEHGFVVWTFTFHPEHDHKDDLPSWMKDVWWYAYKNDCTLILFDCDAVKMDIFPKWDW